MAPSRPLGSLKPLSTPPETHTVPIRSSFSGSSSGSSRLSTILKLSKKSSLVWLPSAAGSNLEWVQCIHIYLFIIAASSNTSPLDSKGCLVPNRSPVVTCRVGCWMAIVYKYVYIYIMGSGNPVQNKPWLVG